MKNLSQVILSILLLSFQSCNTNEVKEPSIENPNLKHFGFTLIDVGWDDPHDAALKTNYVDEIAGFTNMADILITSPDDNIIDRLQNMNQHQVKAILHLNDLFFEHTGTGGQLSGQLYDLRSDYKARWNTFLVTNKLTLNSDMLQSFFIGEEPTWNSISFSELKSAADYIKSTITTVPILIIESYAAIHLLQIPSSIDWVGFDHYFIKNVMTDNMFKSELALLKSKRTSAQQKIVLVMDTHYISSVHGSFGISETDMKSVATSYYQLAKSDTNVVAILGYFWPGGFDDPSSKGARNLSQVVKDEHVKIGKAITGK